MSNGMVSRAHLINQIKRYSHILLYFEQFL